jgi:hypothetical protein
LPLPSVASAVNKAAAGGRPQGRLEGMRKGCNDLTRTRRTEPCLKGAKRAVF